MDRKRNVERKGAGQKSHADLEQELKQLTKEIEDNEKEFESMFNDLHKEKTELEATV